MKKEITKLLNIKIEKIKSRKFEKIIPEFYELNQVIENNPWHNNDSVFNHSLADLRELKKMIWKAIPKIKTYLNEKVDTYSRKELLFLATLLHDIGKKETFKQENNLTRCPGHEEKSAEKLRHLLSRFDLSNKEKGLLIEVVRNHGFFHDLLDKPEEDLEEKLKKFKRNNPEIFLEVVLFAMANILGSQLKDNKPEEFNFRMNFLKKIIKEESNPKS